MVGWGWVGEAGQGLSLANLVFRAPAQVAPTCCFHPLAGTAPYRGQRASGAAEGFGAWAGVPTNHSEALVFSVDPVLRAGGWLVPSFFFLRRGVKVSYRSALPAGKATQDTI